MKHLTLTCAFIALASSAIAAGPNEAVAVKVWGRDWVVAPVEDQLGVYSAVRLNADLQPFLGPARTRTSQAVRAYHTATGCRADIKSMVQIITGEFRARLVCPTK